MGGKGGGKKGGGGGGSVDVDVDSDSASSMVLDIVGLDDIDIDTTTNSTSVSTNRLEVPDPIQTRMEMALTEPIDTRLTVSVPDTIRTDQQQRNEVAITEPVVAEVSADVDLDLKPVVVDLCLTLGVKDPPRFCLSRPYDRHFGFRLFGQEVIGVDWCGQTQFIVDDIRRNAHIAGVTETPAASGHGHQHDKHDDPAGPGVRLVID